MHFFASFGLLLFVLGFSGGSWHVWDQTGGALIPAGRYLIATGILLLAAVALKGLLQGQGLPRKDSLIDPRIWSIGLIAIYCSDWIVKPWGLFKGPSIRGELLVGAVICYALLRKNLWGRLIGLWPILTIALLAWSYSIASNGSLLFSDDHAMFIFRLKLLKEHFPSIPFWSPLWNTGIDARDFFATGALNIFLLGSPLLYLFPVENVYPLIITGILWIVAPISTFAAARVMKLSIAAASISTILTLCSGLFWFRWSLKYGTAGFITSTALFPLVIALAIHVIQSKRPAWTSLLTLCTLSTLMLLWSPSGLAVLPVLLVALPHLPRLVRSKRHILALLCIIALNLPWMSMMWKVSNVGRFLNSHSPAASPFTHQPHSTQQPPGAPELSVNDSDRITLSKSTSYRHRGGPVTIRKVLNQWQNNAISLNPLLVIFAVPAFLAFSGSAAPYLITTALWLLILGTVGVSIKPQLELDRMIIIGSILTTIPIGQYLAHLFQRSQKSPSWMLASSIVGAFLLIGTFATTSVVLNRSDDKYSFADQEVYELTDTLASHASGGRVFFSGCVLHQLSGGHLAPLAMWANTPMVASSYAHNIWRYTQPIPSSLLARGDSGIQEFLNLINATIVVAHEPAWLEYFKARRNEYQRIWNGNTFHVFKRSAYTPTYTTLGELRNLSFSSSSITFIPQTESLTLKFRHFPFLQSSHCQMRAEPSVAGFDLISLSHCPLGTPITIKSISPLERLVGSSSS